MILDVLIWRLTGIRYNMKIHVQCYGERSERPYIFFHIVFFIKCHPPQYIYEFNRHNLHMLGILSIFFQLLAQYIFDIKCQTIMSNIPNFHV